MTYLFRMACAGAIVAGLIFGDPAPAKLWIPKPHEARMITTSSGLKYIDEKVGDGAVAKAGDNVSVHYTGTLADGKKFDSSVDRGQPFNFPLGQGRVIKGWDEGVAGMKVGGKRKLTIPSEKGYGLAGSPPKIPQNAGLKFDVELLEIKGAGAGAADAGKDAKSR